MLPLGDPSSALWGRSLFPVALVKNLTPWVQVMEGCCRRHPHGVGYSWVIFRELGGLNFAGPTAGLEKNHIASLPKNASQNCGRWSVHVPDGHRMRIVLGMWRVPSLRDIFSCEMVCLAIPYVHSAFFQCRHGMCNNGEYSSHAVLNHMS
jgi:hypothetical protein